MRNLKIEIRNCNNIDNGIFSIEEGKLNIFYATNGSGKTTISQAIKNYGSNDLEKMKPFKYLQDEDSTHKPIVKIDMPPSKTAIFNEDYINQYVFKKDELLANSFEIFIKSESYDAHMKAIGDLISEITNTFQKDQELENLINDLNLFIESFGRVKGYSKNGKLAKSLGVGNKLNEIPAELKQYEPYLKAEEKSVDWLKWQAEGKEYLDITESCPFCVSHITTPKATILKVAQTYDVKYLSTVNQVLKVFKSLAHYFSDETKNALEKIQVNTSGLDQSQVSFLLDLKTEVANLRDKLIDLKGLGYDSLKDTDKIQDTLDKKKIELIYMPKLKSVYLQEKINVINQSIESILSKIGQLQGEVNKQRIETSKTIEHYKNEIGSFLEMAGYPYLVDIENNGENDYKLILRFSNTVKNITEVKSHLSFGEKNAFALVLFMYQALKEKADFIILDDPISSFDNNKKYAILNKLFRGRDSFQDHTVLMLTHDFEPVIDTIYNIPHLFNPNPVAVHLYNKDGDVIAKNINKSDIKSSVEICKDNMMMSEHMICKLIYLRRLIEISNSKGDVWQMLSNLFHKDREKPQWNNGDKIEIVDCSDKRYKAAEEEINKNIDGFNYKEGYAIINNKENLLKAYKECKSGYEKLQIFRRLFDGVLKSGEVLKKYIDQTCHVQNDYLFQLNPREFELVPFYIIAWCDDSVDKLIEQIKKGD